MYKYEYLRKVSSAGGERRVAQSLASQEQLYFSKAWTVEVVPSPALEHELLNVAGATGGGG